MHPVARALMSGFGANMAAEFRRGWPVLLMGIAGIYAMNILTYPTSILVKPIGQEWGWSRGETTAFISFGSLVTLLVGPWAGTVVRRYGPTRTAFCGSIVMALGLVAVGHSGPHLLLWYTAWVIYAIAQQFSTVIVWSYATSIAFARSRGMALALVMSGSAIAAATMPGLTLWFYDRLGIAGTYSAFGAMVIVLALPMLVLRVDGMARSPSSARGPKEERATDTRGLTLREALRTARFWQLSIGITLIAGIVSSVIFHAHSLMTDSGLSVTTATWVMSLLGPSLLVGRLGTGFLLDRWSSRAVCLTVVAFPVVTCLIMATFSGSVPLAILAILCCGAAAGAEGDILAYFASRHFGLAHYGSIYGLMLGIFSIGFGSFPPIAGFVFDRTGSYGTAFWLFSGLLAIAVVLLLKAGDYPDEFAVRPVDGEHDRKESRDDGAHTADPVRG